MPKRILKMNLREKHTQCLNQCYLKLIVSTVRILFSLQISTEEEIKNLSQEKILKKWKCITNSSESELNNISQ